MQEPPDQSGLARPEVDTHSAKLTRARGLRSAVEDFGLPGDLKVGETDSDDRRFDSNRLLALSGARTGESSSFTENVAAFT